MNRKIIASFPSLLEAKTAVNMLQAQGLDAIINNELAASMLPHAANALGGFEVSVSQEQEAEAMQLLNSIDVETVTMAEPITPARDVELMMKKAAYGAVMGAIFLPIVANLFSLAMLWRAFQKNRTEFFLHPWLLIISISVNIGIIIYIFTVLISLK